VTIASEPTRHLQTSTETFKAAYNKNPIIDTGFPDSTAKVRPILKNSIGDRTVEPLQPLQNPWDAPFFYEDSRHVFYVTTAETQVTLEKFNGYGVGDVGVIVDELPPIVVSPDIRFKQPVDRTGVLEHTPGFGKVDPNPIERELAKQTNIRAAIGSTSSVRFGDKDLGPSGALSKQAPIRQ
jgi:hypothetical protein